jgi:hypothetical protein
LANFETIQASLDRMEREQKIRDDGLRRSFAIFVDEVQRLQRMLAEHASKQAMPMQMGEFITLMTTMLERQRLLLESISQRVEEGGDPAC